MDLTHITQSALRIVTEVGEFVAGEFYKPQQITQKGIRNPQTDTDTNAERLLSAKLHELLPEAGFIREEEAGVRGKRYNWVIDPIDGTKYFSTQCPLFYTQIALLDGDEIIFSAIYQPIARQMFYAVKGRGAYMDHTRLYFSDDGPLSRALVNLEIGHIGTDPHRTEVLSKLSKAAHRIHLISGVLAPYALTNTVQAYVKYCTVTPIYDIAPRLLLYTEAHATVKKLDFRGTELMIVAHEYLANEIEKTICG